MKISILTEGSSIVGFGHVTRCLSLLQAFQAKDLTVQLIVNGDYSIESLLVNVDYIILDWINDSNKLSNFLTMSDIVVVDSYYADASFYKKHYLNGSRYWFVSMIISGLVILRVL